MLTTALKSRTFWSSLLGIVMTCATALQGDYKIAGLVLIITQSLVTYFHLNPSQTTQNYQTNNNIVD